MKPFKLLSTVLVLAVATTVTAGSMYITVRAATQQETDAAVSADAAAPKAESIDEVDVGIERTRILRDRQHHVILDENGGFRGRLTSLQKQNAPGISADGLNVKLWQDGAEIASTTTDADGRFEFTGLPEGVIAIWAEGEDSLLLYTFVTFNADSNIPENEGLLTANLELDLESSVISGAANVDAAKNLMFAFKTTPPKRFTEKASEDDEKFGYGNGEPSSTLVQHSVQLQPDGSLTGSMHVLDERTGRHRAIEDLTVHFLHEGNRVASATVAADGNFVARGLRSGIHSVVAVGTDGVIGFGLDVVDSGSNPAAGIDAHGEYRMVSLPAASLSINGSPVGLKNFGAMPIAPGSGGGPGSPGTAPPGSQMAGSPGGSGGGTGGGGSAGGGGLAGLLFGAAAGVGGYLAGQNNSDPPASP